MLDLLLISSVHSVTITRYTSYGVRATLPLDMEYDTLLATHAQATRKLRASYA